MTFITFSRGFISETTMVSKALLKKTSRHISLCMEDLRVLLQNELSRRCTRNPRYSLRAFAKSLDISHTVLSLVMSGKRAVSKNLRVRLTEVFGNFDAPAESFQQITLDAFTVISDWYHYAILSLLETENSSIRPNWIAKRLGITPIEAKLAIERLKRLELIENANGTWKQTGLPIRIDNEMSTSVTRKFHKQLLAKAIDSLEDHPKHLRDFSSMTMAIDPDLIPYAAEEIKKFRRSLTHKLEKKGKPKQVYNLTVQLFPVSKPGEVK